MSPGASDSTLPSVGAAGVVPPGPSHTAGDGVTWPQETCLLTWYWGWDRLKKGTGSAPNLGPSEFGCPAGKATPLPFFQ